jgi:membrane-associated PAP2 superfamily phosphatase
LQFGTPGQGQSFLSGHAAAAWYWFGLFWALPRPGLRWLSLLLTLVYGALMALARVS